MIPARIRNLCSGLLAAALLTGAQPAFSAATIVINNINAAGVGFNDPTPAAPVGGNTGTTLGAQRLNAFQAAANIWGATVTSSVTIVIDAEFAPLPCNATGAVLGAAGTQEVFINFASGIKPNTLYPGALANKYAGTDLSPASDIGATFNSNLGQAGCLTGIFFYLGLDNNHGANVDLVTVLLHEFGHGLGFQTFTDESDGTFFAGFPSIWDYFIHDETTGKNWVNMTNAERIVSGINTRNVSWAGPLVTAAAPGVLAAGVPKLGIQSLPLPSASGSYDVGTAAFGPPLASPGVSGQLMPVAEQTAGAGQGCEPFNAINTMAVSGNVALIDRGTCGFAVKTKNAQNAGAKAVVIVNNAPGSPAPGMAGIDPTITIPAVMVTQSDGNKLKAALAFRSRKTSGVLATVGINGSQLAGTSAAGRVLLYTPNPDAPGSSVSHWDTIARPNLLMEPNINGDLLHVVIPPNDLTFTLLRDIGW